MDSTTQQKTGCRAVGCEEVPTEEAQKKFVDVCNKTKSSLSSPGTAGSPAKPVHDSEKSGSPLKPAGGDSLPDGGCPGKQSTEENGVRTTDEPNSTDDVKTSENGSDQPEVSGDVPQTESPENKSEDGQVSGTAEETEAAVKPEEMGSQSEAGGEAEHREEREPREESNLEGSDGHAEGKETSCGKDAPAESSSGADNVNGSLGKVVDDIGQKVDLIKLDGSPAKIQSPTKTSCAAI